MSESGMVAIIILVFALNTSILVAILNKLNRPQPNSLDFITIKTLLNHIQRLDYAATKLYNIDATLDRMDEDMRYRLLNIHYILGVAYRDQLIEFRERKEQNVE